MALSSEQLAQFERDGVLVLEGFATPEECDKLKQEAERLVDGFDASTISIFSTKEQTVLSFGGSSIHSYIWLYFPGCIN